MQAADCVKIVTPKHMKYRTSPTSTPLTTAAWLDPAINFLPRRIVTTEDDSADVSHILYQYYDIEYTTIRGEDGKDYFFPASGHFRSKLNNVKIELLQATINGSVSSAVFRPTFPELAVVREEIANQRPREYIIGDPNKREKVVRELQEKQSKGFDSSGEATKPSEQKILPSARPADTPGPGKSAP